MRATLAMLATLLAGRAFAQYVPYPTPTPTRIPTPRPATPTPTPTRIPTPPGPLWSPTPTPTPLPPIVVTPTPGPSGYLIHYVCNPPCSTLDLTVGVAPRASGTVTVTVKALP